MLTGSFCLCFCPCCWTRQSLLRISCNCTGMRGQLRPTRRDLHLLFSLTAILGRHVACCVLEDGSVCNMRCSVACTPSVVRVGTHIAGWKQIGAFCWVQCSIRSRLVPSRSGPYRRSSSRIFLTAQHQCPNRAGRRGASHIARTAQRRRCRVLEPGK